MKYMSKSATYDTFGCVIWGTSSGRRICITDLRHQLVIVISVEVRVRVRVRLRIRLRDRDWVISDATNNTTSRSRDQFSSTRGSSRDLDLELLFV
jgi:hypothetical protein